MGIELVDHSLQVVEFLTSFSQFALRREPL